MSPGALNETRRGLRAHRGDAVAVLSLVLLPVVLLGRALLPGRVLSPADNLLTLYPWKGLAPAHVPATPVFGDVTFIFHPWLKYAAEEIRAGRFPLWDPHAFTGAPFFANPQSAMLFPFTVLAYVLPVPTALGLVAILKLAATGLGMYWFLRELRTAPLAATVGSMAFMCSSVTALWLQWSYGTTLMFLPLLFAMAERLRRQASGRRVAALALVVALGLLSGYPQGLAYALSACLAWVLYRAWGAAGGWRFVAGALAGTGLGAGLAAAQIVPFLEYARESAVYAYRSEWMPVLSLPARAAITLLMPYYYGSPAGGDFWGSFVFNEVVLSVGLVPWMALPLALVGAWSRAGTKFFLGMTLVAGALGFGVPGVTSLLTWLPPFSLAVHLRVLALFVFGSSALCAIGLDAIARMPGARQGTARVAVKATFTLVVGLAFAFVVEDYGTAGRRALRVGAAAQYAGFLILWTAAALGIAGWLGEPAGSPRRWGWLVLAVQIASTAPLVVTQNPVIETRWWYPLPPLLRYLQAERTRDLGRIQLPAGSNMGLVYRLDEVGGYDGMTPRRIEELAGPGTVGPMGNGHLTVTAGAGTATYDLLGIRHVVVAPGAAPPGPHMTLVYDGADGRVYRYGRALPRAFLVWRARTCVEDGAGLRLLRGGAIDVSEEVVLAGCDPLPAVGPPGKGGAVLIREYASERVRMEVSTEGAAWLVLTDSWFPGWRAWVDGVEGRVWRADHAFRAIWVPAGRHAVEFRYQPVSVRVGLAVTLLAALATAGLCLWRGRGE